MEARVNPYLPCRPHYCAIHGSPRLGPYRILPIPILYRMDLPPLDAPVASSSVASSLPGTDVVKKGNQSNKNYMVT